MDERIGFGLNQSCGNKGIVGRMFVFWLRLLGGVWGEWVVGSGFGPGSGGVWWC